MIVVQIDRIGIKYGALPVFSGLSWEIQNDRVIGLIGPNGCGKSTLLKMICGQLEPDDGRVIVGKTMRIGYLEQEPQMNENAVLFDEVLSAATEFHALNEALQSIEVKLSDPEVYGDEKALTRILTEQDKLLRKYDQMGGANFEGRARTTLLDLGFTEEDLSLPVNVLSGGQKKLAGLAKLLITQPDLLLLDEPDNHLDMEGKTFLEKLIRNFQGGVVIVSHDRYLLDLMVDEIVELEDGRLTSFPGNYSEYAYEKQARLLRQQQMYQAQQKEINRLEQSAKRLLTWGHVYDNEKFIKRGQNILKRIERIDKIDKPVMERKTMGLELSGWRGSNKVLEVIDLHKGFDSGEGRNEILKETQILLWHGERVGLVGPNGAGKSVLFRLLLGQEAPDSGEVKIGPSIKVGYYAQEHETLDYNRTLIETIRLAKPISEDAAVSFLGKFLFKYEQTRGEVGNLSGGERSRLQLALLMLSGANFLLLDEPTNNLDIPSAEVLEDALDEFEGTVLTISHDRYFLDRTANRILELADGQIKEYLGGYNDYFTSTQNR